MKSRVHILLRAPDNKKNKGEMNPAIGRKECEIEISFQDNRKGFVNVDGLLCSIRKSRNKIKGDDLVFLEADLHTGSQEEINHLRHQGWKFYKASLDHYSLPHPENPVWINETLVHKKKDGAN